MYNKQLERIGLSCFQSLIYDFLARNGISTASRIARITNIQRSTVYQILQELLALQLITKDNTKKVTRFTITNPQRLHVLVAEKASAIKIAEQELIEIEEQLKQEYAIQSGQPGVRFYSGVQGLKNLYKDINASEINSLLIIRSNQQAEPEMTEIIRNQVELQMRQGIEVKVVNSSADYKLTANLSFDAERYTERRIIPAEVFSNPAQIIIYANKIAFTTYRKPNITVVIEHADIAETLRSVYEYLWVKSKIDTKYFMDNIAKLK